MLHKICWLLQNSQTQRYSIINYLELNSWNHEQQSPEFAKLQYVVFTLARKLHSKKITTSMRKMLNVVIIPHEKFMCFNFHCSTLLPMKLLQTNIMINCPESYMHFICSLFSDLIYTETSGDREGRTVEWAVAEVWMQAKAEVDFDLCGTHQVYWALSSGWLLFKEIECGGKSVSGKHVKCYFNKLIFTVHLSHQRIFLWRWSRQATDG